MNQTAPRDGDRDGDLPYQRVRDLLRNGGVGIALVTAGTAALVAAAAAIALVIVALY